MPAQSGRTSTLLRFEVLEDRVALSSLSAPQPIVFVGPTVPPASLQHHFAQAGMININASNPASPQPTGRMGSDDDSPHDSDFLVDRAEERSALLPAGDFRELAEHSSGRDSDDSVNPLMAGPAFLGLLGNISNYVAAGSLTDTELKGPAVSAAPLQEPAHPVEQRFDAGHGPVISDEALPDDHVHDVFFALSSTSETQMIAPLATAKPQEADVLTSALPSDTATLDLALQRFLNQFANDVTHEVSRSLREHRWLLAAVGASLTGMAALDLAVRQVQRRRRSLYNLQI